MPGLDGLRGLAALYVVIFHCWLYTFRRFRVHHDPAWLGWLMYGHLAVVFFLMLSGFSLALTAAAHGWQLGGRARFLRRRAWRILPPYWAALVFSLIISWAVVPASHFGPPTSKTVVVYGSLLQDVVWAPTPNGSFWSIAVEAELYLAFPLLLFIRRRLGAVILLAGVSGLVVGPVLVAANGTPRLGSTGLTLQLSPIFALGLVSAGVITAGERVRRLPWLGLAALAAVPIVRLMAAKGPVWTAHHYFWIDLAIGPAMAMLLVAVASGRSAMLVRLLVARPLDRLGGFSYSLYLIHLPFVLVVSRLAVHFLGRGLPALWVTLGCGLPISLIAARVFSLAFEIPFQRYRSGKALATAALTLVRSLASSPPPDGQRESRPKPSAPDAIARPR